MLPGLQLASLLQQYEAKKKGLQHQHPNQKKKKPNIQGAGVCFGIDPPGHCKSVEPEVGDKGKKKDAV